MSKSDLEAEFERAAQIVGLPEYEREYRFQHGRQWKFDFAWPGVLVAVEIEGGEWLQGADKSGRPRKGRHTTGAGFVGDCEKYNAAVMASWLVLRFPGSALKRDPVGCAEMVRILLQERK